MNFKKHLTNMNFDKLGMECFQMFLEPGSKRVDLFFSFCEYGDFSGSTMSNNF